MNHNERVRVNRAIEHLFANPCEWEEAMEILFPLAGRRYLNPQKAGGRPIPLDQVMMNPPKQDFKP